MIRNMLIAGIVTLALASGAEAQRIHNAPDATNGIDGRARWNDASQYDSGSDNDRDPARPYYQQGGGQQTGGPARNRIGGDGFNLSPR